VREPELFKGRKRTDLRSWGKKKKEKKAQDQRGEKMVFGLFDGGKVGKTIIEKGGNMWKRKRKF